MAVGDAPTRRIACNRPRRREVLISTKTDGLLFIKLCLDQMGKGSLSQSPAARGAGTTRRKLGLSDNR